MKVLITGCKGQVGYCLESLLSKRNDLEVFAYDRDQLDITDSKQVQQVLAELKPNVIVNAAAHTAVDKAESEIDASYAINRDGPYNLAKGAQLLNALLLHISTDYVFDGNKCEPYTENDLPNPKGIYGKSKLAGEQAVISNCSRYVVLRTAWVFGEHGNNFVKTMLHLGKERSELGIIGDQFGGPTYAGDIAHVLVTIMDEFKGVEQSGIYHFSGEPYVSWYQFAKKIFDSAVQTGVIESAPKINEITTEQYPVAAPRPINSRLNCSKIKKEFGVEKSDWLVSLLNIKAYG
ncbi:dTDP-4-dehydrorhamnose reductase [Vibrio halioticoli NBRC 102217]|uniref:dTDP-4-dehydrorhamnose reductase n=1 Tax=Vibrio halioticoli NBRC 102217 TaxID=1219072 RepID=V5FMJ2_9VIBR|nr:dTDP-4-dehydrorhamnose reductase [Vibrio halioticoli]GAD90062.1 dTDP-4-dehydrorhamnose reductase [Vibrio halioticoli NBRC 102217]